MSDFQALHTLLIAGELLAISVLVLAAAGLYVRNKTAGQRHLVWSCAFAALLAVPVIAALVPGSIVWTLPAPPQILPAEFVPQDYAAIVAAPAPAPSFQFDIPALAQAFVLLWLAGFGLIVLRSLFAAFVLNRLRADSIENPFEASELPPPARLSHADLRVSNGEHGPVTWGVFKPVILLPQRALYWSSDRLEAVLLHELAHVQRNDSLAQMLSLLACAFYWPNPLVWMAAARMRRDAEMATDDAVLCAGLRASDYAGELLQIAAELRARPLTPFAPMHMASPSALEARVKSVLAPTTKRSGVTTMDVLKTITVALLATSALAIARPSLAQDAPPPPPSVDSAPLPPPAPAAEATAPAEAPPPAPVTAEAPMPTSAPDASVPPPPGVPVVNPVPATEAMPAAAPMPAAGASSADAFSYTSPGGKPMNIQVRSYTHRVRGRDVTHTVILVNGKPVDVNAAMARVQPEIDRAMAQMKANQATMRADIAARRQAMVSAEEAMARVEPQIQAALARAQADLAKANIDLRIQQRMDEANKRMQIRIEMQDRNAQDSQPPQDGDPDSN